MMPSDKTPTMEPKLRTHPGHCKSSKDDELGCRKGGVPDGFISARPLGNIFSIVY